MSDLLCDFTLERADLERQLQAAEQRAQEAEQRLSDIRARLQEAEQRIAAAEQRAADAEHNMTLVEERAEQMKLTAEMAQKRAELAEENVDELERKLEEVESDLEELLQYREVVQATQRMSIGPESISTDQQEAGRLLRHSCYSLGSYFITHKSPRKMDSPSDGQSHCGDELSITSL